VAVITDSTFNPLLAHVNVRMQQGVPIVDADWNTQDDIRKFELRAFLKWYVGDGVPDQNDGFRIAAGDPNSFVIRAGRQGGLGSLTNQETALRQVGRFIVDGLDVFLRSDVAFHQQPLHESQPGAAALATRLGIPVITGLQTPKSDQSVVVELDVWERLLTPDEEPKLIHPALGVETCARTRREWVVRAYPSTEIGERLAGHSYATLAMLQRFANQETVADGQIIDRRQRKLLVPPASLVTDMLGVDPYEYRAGQGRPPISIRDAINALLAGQLPTTVDLAVSEAPGNDDIRRAFVLDSQNGLAAFWMSPRATNGIVQVYGTRIDLNTPDATFAPAVQVTNAGTPGNEPTAVALPNGEFIVAYQTGQTGNAASDVKFKRGTLAGLPTASPQTISDTANAAEDLPFAVLTGDIVTFFFRQGTGWSFRRYKHTDGTFLDPSPVSLGTPTATGSPMHAAAAGGFIWFAYGNSGATTLTMGRLNPGPAAAVVDTVIPAALTGTTPFVVAVSSTDAMVFYRDNGIKTMVASSTGWASSGVLVPGSDTAADVQPAVARDPDGTLFLLTARTVSGTNTEIFLRRRDPFTSLWGAAQQVISNPSADQNPHPLRVSGQGIWLLWRSDRNGASNADLFAKRIVTSI